MYPLLTMQYRTVPKSRVLHKPLAAPPPLDAPTHALDCGLPRSAQNRPIGRARPRATAVGARWHVQVYKVCERRERAWHTPRQLIVAEVAAKPASIRPPRAILRCTRRSTPPRTTTPYLAFSTSPLNFTVMLT